MKGSVAIREKSQAGMVERLATRTTSAPEADAADIGELYRRHAETVARWVARLGGPLVDVDDAVHEVFVIAQRRRPTTEGPAQITTWLYRVTTRVVSHRRRKDRWRRWLRGSATDAAGSLASGDASPIERLEAKERAALVYRVLDRLPDKQRAVLILFEMEGLSGDQIAALYGAKVGTIWVWLHRARAAFLAEMRRLDGEGGRS
jgi:RNA polymerase sigma-70 factor (ECF subfamily)